MSEQTESRREEAVRKLVRYGIRRKLIGREDAGYAANRLFDILRVEPSVSFHFEEKEGEQIKEEAESLDEILGILLDDAICRGIIEESITDRDLLDTRLMEVLTPRPSEVIETFWEKYEDDPEDATDYFYRLAGDTNYIRTERVAKDQKWVVSTQYGDLDMTINLSKPEKDPKAIAAAKNRACAAYPKCLLCPENEGYAGRADHPARQTLRLIPLTLGAERWYLQYSPYVYYNEHCIVLSGEHRPMLIDRGTFVRLLEFVMMFPHYTVGSNADLPIVGGSILTHEHFQGGRYTFAMERAAIRKQVTFTGYEEVEAGIVNWPMSVLRLSADTPDPLIELATKILTAWRLYSDESVQILCESEQGSHNTITPIARMREGRFELDLVLRNNRTTEEHPLGIFHPHEELHHIKKENIGLIEVMGLAVLPARLRQEIDQMEDFVLQGKEIEEVPELKKHGPWLKEILDRHPEYKKEAVLQGSAASEAQFDRILKEEIGQVFVRVLEHCGVFKEDEEGGKAFDRFIDEVNVTGQGSKKGDQQ